MEQIKQIETEITNLRKQVRDLESKDEDLYEDNEWETWCRDERKSQQYRTEISELEEKIKSRQQMIQTLTRSGNTFANRNNQRNSSSSSNNQQNEIRELKQIILRLERKVDNLQTQLSALTNQQQRQGQPTNRYQAQMQVPPKGQRKY